MPVVRWEFEDPVTLDTYEFEINPSSGGSPAYQKSFQYQATAAEDGKTLIFEGRDQVQKINFSGTILTEEHFNAFITWWQKRYQVNITDDLGRTFSIVLESFTPTRERAVLHPWKHSYEVSATIVDWD